MSKISLKHSGGNVVSLNSPTNAPGAADVAFKLPNADGSDGQALVTDGAGNLSFANAGSGTARNLIINGAMQVAQRGTSSTDQSYSYHCIDRFRTGTSGTDEGVTIAQADVASGTTPYTSGFRKCLKITNGNQTSGAGAGGYIQIDYTVEAQDLANNGWNFTSSSNNITFSFWIKSSVAQAFPYSFQTKDGTPQIFNCNTPTLTADTWTKVTKTISGNSNIAIDNDSGGGFKIMFFPYLGTNFTTNGLAEDTWSTFTSAKYGAGATTTTWYTTNDATFEITGVQLEVGSVATDFEHRSFGQELALCHRYCNALMSYGSGDINGNTLYNADYAGGNGMVRMSIPRMRLIPTLTYSIYGGSITYNFSSFDLLQLFDSGDSNFYIYDVLCEAEL